MSRHIEARLTGAGGQGLITAGVILAEAGAIDGKYVVQTQSYGPEARLGSSKAEVIIDESPIAYPQVRVPGLLVCLSEEALTKYGKDVRADTLILLDSSNVEAKPDGPARVVSLPLTEAAVGVGGKMVANIVALAVANSLLKIVAPESLRAAVEKRVPAKFKELNLKALEAGAKLAQGLS